MVISCISIAKLNDISINLFILPILPIQFIYVWDDVVDIMG